MPDGGAAGDDAAVDVDAAVVVDAGYPAFVPHDPPQVVTERGPVMDAPKIIPVFFSKDDVATVAALSDFAAKVGQTHYWNAATSEYGVGAATGLTPIQLTAADDPATVIDDTDIQNWLRAKLQSGDPQFATLDNNTIYLLFYPPGITITLGGTPTVAGPDGGVGGDGGVDGGTRPGGGVQQSCQFFGGYHDNIALDAAHGYKKAAYAVIPRCPAFNGMTIMEGATGTTSHELIEAATDPFPSQTVGAPAYDTVDDAHFFWATAVGGGEVGDMCAQDPASFTKFAELPDYMVQRTWSNQAVAAGLDPCVPPLPNTTYFNSVPVFGDLVPISFGGQTVNVDGVKIAAGASATVELDLFSSAPTAPWTVSAMDTSAMRGGAPQLSFSFDKNTGQNGDKIMMTINVVAASTRKRETFYITSTLNGRSTTWLGVVGN